MFAIKAYDASESYPKHILVFTCLQYESFENTVGKEEIGHNEYFLLFRQCICTILENFPPFSKFE